MAIVHRLVTTALNGRIAFTSSEEAGTTFTVSLPEASAALPVAAAPDSDTAPDVQTPSTPPTRILIVDDEDMVRATLEAMLLREKYQVKTCSNPDSALAQLHDNPGAVEVLMTDQAMPGMTGLELAARLRRVNPDLKIILMSGYLTPEDLDRAR